MIGFRAYAKYFIYFDPRTAARLALAKLKLRKTETGKLVKFDLNGKQSINLRAGTHDIDIFEQIFLLKDCHFETRDDPTFIVDAGAHIGCSALYFAQRFPKANILAIEAESENYRMLCANTKDHEQIKSLHGAVWYREEEVQISNPGSDPWGFQVSSATPSDNTSRVTGYDINSIIALSGRDIIDILKLDIEGAELNVFTKGDLSWLKKVRTIIIELHDRIQPGCTEAFISATKRYGFEIREHTAHNVRAERMPEPHLQHEDISGKRITT
jgi:FkbM family methyltransferase